MSDDMDIDIIPGETEEKQSDEYAEPSPSTGRSRRIRTTINYAEFDQDDNEDELKEDDSIITKPSKKRNRLQTHAQRHTAASPSSSTSTPVPVDEKIDDEIMLGDSEVHTSTITPVRPQQRNRNVYAEAGIINRITLENFLTHKKLFVTFGPNVNFIHGENGSGTTYRYFSHKYTNS